MTCSLIFLVPLGLSCACTSEEGSAPSQPDAAPVAADAGPPDNASEFSGIIRLTKSETESKAAPLPSASAFAQFYSPSFGGIAQQTSPDDGCLVAPAPAQPGSTNFYDAGEEAYFAAAGTDAPITLVRRALQGFVTYLPQSPPLSSDSVSTDTIYTFGWDGGGQLGPGAGGGLLVPAPIEQSAPTHLFAITDALTITWTARDANELVDIELRGYDRTTTPNQPVSIFCRAFDDGEFTIDYASIAMLPAGSADLEVTRTITRPHYVGNDAWIELIGVTEHNTTVMIPESP